jgi:Zn-dependent protease with chaperone function
VRLGAATALALAALAVALAWPAAQQLAGAAWARRSPQAALVLWQAFGLAGGLAAVGAGLALGLAALSDGLLSGLAALLEQTARGQPLRGLGPVAVLGLTFSALLGGRLLWVLGRSWLRTLRLRRRHRALVDLVATPWPTLGGARVLDSPSAVAYCLPGLRPRVVVSAGALDVLRPEELDAVLAHERAHATERHDLVVLPFVALGATLPVLPTVRWAQESVAELIEMLADDRALRAGHEPRDLASALFRVSTGAAPSGALGSSGQALSARVHRLLEPPDPAPLRVRLAAYAGAAALVAVPPLLLLAPDLA